MKVKVSFHGCMEIEVDDKYTPLDTEEVYDNEAMSLVYDLEEDAKRIVKEKINIPDIDIYDFNYCEVSGSGVYIWDY